MSYDSGRSWGFYVTHEKNYQLAGYALSSDVLYDLENEVQNKPIKHSQVRQLFGEQVLHIISVLEEKLTAFCWNGEIAYRDRYNDFVITNCDLLIGKAINFRHLFDAATSCSDYIIECDEQNTAPRCFKLVSK